MSGLKVKNTGFTLVELSISLVVIGILIGGVVLGAEMIKNSRLSATFAKTQTVAAALNVFIDKYHALPGDMPDATARLKECDNTPANTCRNGNGDRVIGSTSVDIFEDQTGANDFENTLFWYHLNAANLLLEINLDSPTAPRAWEVTNPAAPAGGGFNIRTMTGTFNDIANDALVGAYIVWQKTAAGAANTAANAVVSPTDASYIDRKFDDNSPLSGKVRARGTNNGSGADACRTSATVYNSGGGETCYMYFRIREVSGL